MLVAAGCQFKIVLEDHNIIGIFTNSTYTKSGRRSPSERCRSVLGISGAREFFMLRAALRIT